MSARHGTLCFTLGAFLALGATGHQRLALVAGAAMWACLVWGRP